MTRRDPRANPFEVVGLIDEIFSYTSGLDAEGFAANQLVQLAVERQLISIGENLAVLRREWPAIAEQVEYLPQIIGMRNVLVHAYRIRDLDIVWLVVALHLAPLRLRMGALIEELTGPA